MSGLLQILGNWGHVLCAGLFAALAIWIARRMAAHLTGRLLGTALALTCIWSLSVAFTGVHRLETGVAETLRNFGWLVCLFVLPTQFGRYAARAAQGARPLYAVLVALLVAQCGLDILASLTSYDAAGLASSAIVLRMLWVIGALILVQRIFVACAPAMRAIVAPVAAALAAMWSYDLFLYGSAFLQNDHMATLLFALRGSAMALLAPVIALTTLTMKSRIVAPSRALAWRGLGLAAGLVLTLLLLSAIQALGDIGSPLIRAVATAFLFAAVAGMLLFLPATRFQATLRLLAAKHLFRHRYDYREQWMRFADTIGHADKADASIDRRLVKAMADITDSASGALLMLDEGGRFLWQCDLNWKGDHPSDLQLSDEAVARMRSRSWVIDVARERASAESALPPWLAGEESAWALVPLIHFDELIGIVLLSPPPVMRTLDWEDFDMLRAAGRQVASYIAEARGQQALAEARRFDEFNRRFAFIMHDIKNLVSQIGLVARNAERHADNPEFRADMILTLKDCADRMNTLLARLSQHNSRAEPGPARFAIGDAVRSLIAARGGAHPLLAEGDLSLEIEADRARLELLLGHLVQNAVDASDPASPVIVRAERAGNHAQIVVIDHGCGMSAEFIRDELFRPFSSTKQGGFGIGAYEARSLAASMGGTLTVESRPGSGSRFTLDLPLAARAAQSTERAA